MHYIVGRIGSNYHNPKLGLGVHVLFTFAETPYCEIGINAFFRGGQIFDFSYNNVMIHMYVVYV